MTIQDEIVQELSSQMCSDMDFHILKDVLCRSGWTEVVLTPMTKETSDSVDSWLKDNCRGEHLNRGLVWIFEQHQDANWFALRWV